MSSLGFLLVLFVFVGNKLNQASTVKRSKRGPKRKNKASQQATPSAVELL